MWKCVFQPLGQTCEKHASMDFHVKTMSAGSDPKRINHFLFFIFFSLARIVPIDRRIKKKHQRGFFNQDLFDLFLLRESYIESYYFLFLCSHKSLRFTTNSEIFQIYFGRTKLLSHVKLYVEIDTRCSFDFNKGRSRNVKKNIIKCINKFH